MRGALMCGRLPKGLAKLQADMANALSQILPHKDGYLGLWRLLLFRMCKGAVETEARRVF